MSGTLNPPQPDNTRDGELDDILSQAFTDGASDTMWQNDRHVEIYATAKKRLERLIAQEANKAVVNELRYVRDKLTADTPTFINIQDRIAQLTPLNKEEVDE